jgi:hypothetical protein
MPDPDASSSADDLISNMNKSLANVKSAYDAFTALTKEERGSIGSSYLDTIQHNSTELKKDCDNVHQLVEALRQEEHHTLPSINVEDHDRDDSTVAYKPASGNHPEDGDDIAAGDPGDVNSDDDQDVEDHSNDALRGASGMFEWRRTQGSNQNSLCAPVYVLNSDYESDTESE